MSKDTGGQAFPTSGNALEGVKEGMTLRDYFAGQALAGLIEKYEGQNENSLSGISESAYQYADAMLKARKATNA